MTNRTHTEEHFQGSDIVKDIVIGMSDGLTVPFALAAGISGAIDSTRLIVAAGLAEIAAGSVAMALGGYLAAKSEAQHYAAEKKREEWEIEEKPEAEKREVSDILQQYGLTETEAGQVISGLMRRPDSWCDFMMRFELGLEKPDPKRSVQSAYTIGLSYIVGGFVPLSPYMFASSSSSALWVSIAFTLSALFIFGVIKGRFTGYAPVKSGLQTLGVGGLAATVAYILAKLVS